MNEIISAIDMLNFNIEIKKILLIPFIHTEEYKNTKLLKYFDEFDIYLFPDVKLKYFLSYLKSKLKDKSIKNKLKYLSNEGYYNVDGYQSFIDYYLKNRNMMHWLYVLFLMN